MALPRFFLVGGLLLLHVLLVLCTYVLVPPHQQQQQQQQHQHQVQPFQKEKSERREPRAASALSYKAFSSKSKVVPSLRSVLFRSKKAASFIVVLVVRPCIVHTAWLTHTHMSLLKASSGGTKQHYGKIAKNVRSMTLFKISL